MHELAIAIDQCFSVQTMKASGVQYYYYFFFALEIESGHFSAGQKREKKKEIR